MRRTIRYVAISLALPFGASLALAQHEGHQMPAQKDGQIQADPRVRASLAEIERLNMTIESARQTNDPAKMRAAIDGLESSLAAIRANLLAVPPPEPMSMTPTSAGAMDHSKMAMPGTKQSAENEMNPMEGMDHSHMDMPAKSASPKKPDAKGSSSKKAASEKEMAPMKGMDHSHMDMPGMGAAPKKSETKSASPSKGSTEQPLAPPKTSDPICFKQVDTQGAEKATYKGKTYYFCSKADKEKFLGDPDSYVKR